MAATIAELGKSDLERARTLLARASALENELTLVAEEKLFGAAPDPSPSIAVGAWDADELVGVALVSARWLRVLAVEPAARRRGVGTLLLDHCVKNSREVGTTRLRTGDQPGNYIAPGIDERDHETITWFERRGFRRVGVNENLRVPLVDNPRVTRSLFEEQAKRHREHGYEVRRAHHEDAEGLLGFVRAHFSAIWAFETERALAVNGVHVAIHGGSPVAFAVRDGNNSGLGWFGPAGTLPSHRGRGLGHTLLLGSLVDMAEAGRAFAVIAWIGPRGFYEDTVGAVSDRRFVVLERLL